MKSSSTRIPTGNKPTSSNPSSTNSKPSSVNNTPVPTPTHSHQTASPLAPPERNKPANPSIEKEDITPTRSQHTHVIVSVRVRPLNQNEKVQGAVEAWSVTNDEKCIFQTFVPSESSKNKDTSDKDKNNNNPNDIQAQLHSFDFCFPSNRSNNYIYERIGQPLIENLMKGFNGCIAAYGQSSSGKTFTIHGNNNNNNSQMFQTNEKGIIKYALDNVFNYIENNPEREFILRMSYLELYKERICDLLCPQNVNLNIREDKARGVFVEGLKEENILSTQQIYALLTAGDVSRHVGRTNFNDHSSRSHTIFKLMVESSPIKSNNSVISLNNASPSKNLNNSNIIRLSSLYVIDLAGSENTNKAGSAERAKETGYINKSLLTLGHCIAKLSELSPSTPSNSVHIPYRDSKLTRILQGSLSGQSYVSMICTVSPSSHNLEETSSTLLFASRAKKVRHQAGLNESSKIGLLRVYRQEIERLRQELLLLKSKNDLTNSSISVIPDKHPTNEASGLMKSKSELKGQIEQLSRFILTSSNNTVSQSNTENNNNDIQIIDEAPTKINLRKDSNENKKIKKPSVTGIIYSSESDNSDSEDDNNDHDNELDNDTISDSDKDKNILSDNNVASSLNKIESKLNKAHEEILGDFNKSIKISPDNQSLSPSPLPGPSYDPLTSKIDLDDEAGLLSLPREVLVQIIKNLWAQNKRLNVERTKTDGSLLNKEASDASNFSEGSDFPDAGTGILNKGNRSLSLLEDSESLLQTFKGPGLL